MLRVAAEGSWETPFPASSLTIAGWKVGAFQSYRKTDARRKDPGNAGPPPQEAKRASYSAQSRGKMNFGFKDFQAPRNGCSEPKEKTGKNKFSEKSMSHRSVHHSKLKPKVTTRKVSATGFGISGQLSVELLVIDSGVCCIK